MKFTLTIDIGGDSIMETCNDVAVALRDLAEGVFAGINDEPTEDSGKIADGNGETVGHWQIENSSAEYERLKKAGMGVYYGR